MLRTHMAGTLSASDVGSTVTLTGWVDRRRDHGGVAFIDLRDSSGIAQVVIREEVAHELRAEFVLRVTGTVELRPEGNANPNLTTGEIEVIARDVEVLNTAAPLPFQVSEHAEEQVGEEARLKYRYLDLRRKAPSTALRLRARANQSARRVLDAHGFVEVETPTLTRSTPRVPATSRLLASRLGTAPSRSPRSSSSSSSWWPAWSGTTRSPGATGTRTSAPTGSRSSRSSTSR